MLHRLPFFHLVTMAAATLAAVFSSGHSTVQAQAVHDGRILFVSRHSQPPRVDVFAMKTDASQPALLTRSTEQEFDPAWSPDGKQIAFTIMPQPVPGQLPASDVYVMNADGSQRRPLTRNQKMLVFAPAWSPDGRRLAFSSWETVPGKGPITYLYVMDADGKNRKRLGEGMVPVWSPTGQQILYTKVTAASNNGPALWRMNADGSQVKAVAANAALGAWSPDGTKIAYVGMGASEQFNIYVMSADGSKKTRLSKSQHQDKNQYQEVGPQWSEDGQRIFFNRLSIGSGGNGGGSTICVMGADGKNVKPVSTDRTFDFMGNGLSFLLYPAFVRSYHQAYQGAKAQQ